MAKLTDKTTFSSTLQNNDLIHVVDVNDLSQSPAGSSYKLTLAQLNAFLASGVTLQQVLTNNPSTGGLDITSPNANTVLSIVDNSFNASVAIPGISLTSYIFSGGSRFEQKWIKGAIVYDLYVNYSGVNDSWTNGTVTNSIVKSPGGITINSSVKNFLNAPINEVSQDATTALGIVTQQQLQASSAALTVQQVLTNGNIATSGVTFNGLTDGLNKVVVTPTDGGDGIVNVYNSVGGVGTNISGAVGVTSNSFIKSGGTSSQFLKANGTVDSTAYSAITYVDAQDVITLASANNYTDNLATGLSWKKSVLYSTTTGENLTLTGLTATIDGTSRTLLATDRILVKNQTTQTLNGLYNPNAGAWTRVVDANSNTSILSATVYVRDGNLEKNRVYAVNVTPITIGTTNITFALINGAGAYTYGAYLKLTGNVFDIDFTTFTTAQITDSTNKRYQTDSQQTNNDATSSIQTQLNAKEVTTNKDASNGYAGLTLFKINFKNALNTFTSFFTNANTASRTYTFQDRNGIIADDTDMAAKQATLVSGTNIKTINGSTLLGSGNLSVGTILGSVGTVSNYGSPIPYNSGVSNTVTSSPFFNIYNSGTITGVNLDNSATNQQQSYNFSENGNYSGLIKYGSAFTTTNYAGTNFSKSNVLALESGNNQNYPIVITGLPIINYCGITGTNAATRLDLIGLRIGTAADCQITNLNKFTVNGKTYLGNNIAATALLHIAAGSATANTAPIKLTSGVNLTTVENGAIEYDGTNLNLTALGTRQTILKGLSGSFSASATAQTAFVVTFGNTQPNTTYQVFVTPTNALSAASLYVVSKTTTTFTVTFLTGLTGTVAFDWILIQ